MSTPGYEEDPKVEAVSDAVCELEIVIIDVAVDEGGAPEIVIRLENEDSEDAKEDLDKAEPDGPKRKFVAIDGEALKFEAVVNAVCGLELAIIEDLFNAEEELKEPDDEDPNDATDDEPAVVLEPEVPELRIELPDLLDTAPTDDAVVAFVGED